MAKVLLFSDLHAHPHKRRVDRLEDCLKVVDWVFEAARSRKIDNIIFGGDLFHDRHKIEVYTYQRVFEALQKNLDGKIKLWLLLGNHDIWYNDNCGISSVIPLSALPGIEVIGDPRRVSIAGATWDFVPFTLDPIQTVEDLSKMPGSPQYAVGHIALHGALMHNETYSEVIIEHDGDMVKVDAKLFKDYTNVFLGHYHAAQQVDDIVEYLGSPLELNFGEAFQKKHVLIFDCITGEKEYLENTFSPKHLIIAQEDLAKYDLEHNFVRIVVDELGAADLVQMRQDILANKAPNSLEIKPKKKKIEEHVIQDAKAILFKEEEMLGRYVDEVGTENLDRTKLLDIGRKICDTTSK
jgi:DNA repair exonuclease SbcCD nuclease subunit